MTANNESSSLRPGFTLVEVVVSIVLLGIILVGLAGLTFQTAQRSVQLADASARQALLLQEVNRISAIPYSAINAQAGCDSIHSGGHRFERCIQVAQVGTTRRVAIVLHSPKLSWPDSVVFMRAQPSAGNPLSMP